MLGGAVDDDGDGDEEMQDVGVGICDDWQGCGLHMNAI